MEPCLAKDPGKRFASAAELRTALDAARAPATPRPDARCWVAAAAGFTSLAALVWLMPRPPLPSPARPTTAPEPHHSLQRVHEFAFTSIDAADAYLVDAVNVKKYREWQTPPIIYWGPTKNGAPAHLTYRFEFPAPGAAIHLVARASCWDFFKEPGGFGRGAAAIDMSRDGSTWHSARNGLEPRLWGVGWDIDEQVPPEACGTSSLWVRVRLLSEDAPNGAYTTAQFGRTVPTEGKPVFAVTATPGETQVPR